MGQKAPVVRFRLVVPVFVCRYVIFRSYSVVGGEGRRGRYSVVMLRSSVPRSLTPTLFILSAFAFHEDNTRPAEGQTLAAFGSSRTRRSTKVDICIRSRWFEPPVPWLAPREQLETGNWKLELGTWNLE